MYTSVELKKTNENLYNNLLKELKRYYTKNNLKEPSRPSGEIYIEELPLIQRLYLNFNGNCDIKIEDKNLISYLTGLKRVIISPPFIVRQEDIETIPNKDQIVELYIDGTNINKLDLSEFINLQDLVISNNYELTELVGLDKLTKLEAFTFYNNKEYDEETICSQITKYMEQEFILNIDILYYKRIIHMIRKEYSKYRKTFKKTTWVEKLSNSIDNQFVKHDSISTGKFYSNLDDLLNEIIPRDCDDDLEVIYLIYNWLITNIISTSKIDITETNDKLDFNDKNQKVRTATSIIGGTNGAFNILPGKSIVCEGYSKIFQLLLKAYDYELNTYDEIACIDETATKLTNSIIKKAKPNHSIIRIDLDDNTYYCDPANEKKTIHDEVSQSRFMRTYRELNSSWFPINTHYKADSEELTTEEREYLSSLKIAHNIPYNYETRAVKIMTEFDLHLENSEKLKLERIIKKEQVEDLVLLGVINTAIERIITNQIDTEYDNLITE